MSLEIPATSQTRGLRRWQERDASAADRRAAAREVQILMRLEGLPGEFSQHDFGQVEVRFIDGTRERIRFFASRLKWSRWVEVTLVIDEGTETLVRTVVDHFVAFGGVPLCAVFDRPVALQWRKDGTVTEWNPIFAYAGPGGGVHRRAVLAPCASSEGIGRESCEVGEGVVLQAGGSTTARTCSTSRRDGTRR